MLKILPVMCVTIDIWHILEFNGMTLNPVVPSTYCACVLCCVLCICKCLLYTFQNSSILGNIIIMTSSNGNIFCVTDHLCGEFTGHRGGGGWRGWGWGVEGVGVGVGGGSGGGGGVQDGNVSSWQDSHHLSSSRGHQQDGAASQSTSSHRTYLEWILGYTH